jgi:predicted small secreted protein
MSIVKQIVVAALIMTVTISGLSCNTIKGAGRDIQEGGEAVEDAADSAQN